MAKKRKNDDLQTGEIAAFMEKLTSTSGIPKERLSYVTAQDFEATHDKVFSDDELSWYIEVDGVKMFAHRPAGFSQHSFDTNKEYQREWEDRWTYQRYSFEILQNQRTMEQAINRMIGNLAGADEDPRQKLTRLIRTASRLDSEIHDLQSVLDPERVLNPDGA